MLTNGVRITLIFSLIHISYGGWKDVLKDIKEKAKENFERKYGNQGTKNFLGHDLSEYPATNEYLRNINKDKWAIYYECLSAQEKNLDHHQSVTPVAVAALQSGSVKLECRICLSPDDTNDIHTVEWYSAMENGKNLELIEFDEHVLVSPEDKSLLMYNLRSEQTGQYMCSLGQSLTAPYFLTVVKSFESDINEVHPLSAKHGPYPAEDILIPGHSLKISTSWGSWSACSQCGKIGKKHRYGFCNVFHYSEGLSQVTKRPPKTINKADLALLKLFQEGIPCASHILPAAIQKLPVVRNRKDEIMIAFCKEKCAEEKVFVVRDEYGNVLEQANNTAGIYSMLQGMPAAEPHIEKTLEYRKADSDITLTCPGNLNSDAPIQWQIGQKIVVGELIAKESEGRIFIRLTDRIHIKRAKVSDTNIYSCWQHKELAGIVRLVVEKKLELNFNHHIMLFAMIVILFTFFWVFTKAFFGRKYARIKD